GPALAYEFRADGTFAEHTYQPPHAVGVGTYRLHPRADNFLELRYPDTGATRTVFAQISADDVRLADGADGLTTLKRVAAPPAPSGLSAEALYAEFLADAKAAAKRYRGEALTLTGVVGARRVRPGAGGGVELMLVTGEGHCLRCTCPGVKA